MKKFYKFTGAAIKMFFRNRQALFFSLFMPLLIMVIFGIIDFSKFGSAKMEVYDGAKNQMSTQFIDTLKKINVLTITTNDNLDNALSDLKKGNTDVVLDIDSNTFNFNPANPQTLQPRDVKMYLSDSKASQGQVATTVVKEVLNNYSATITKVPPLFNLTTESVSARNLRYIDFLVPGVLALAIMQMGLFSVIFVIVTYKRTGVMRRLLVTPIKPYQFIGGQVTTRLIVSLMQVIVIVSVAVMAFHVKIVGSYLLITLLVFWGSIIFLSLGLALANIAKTEESAAPIANLVALPQMFLGNVFFPADSMPVWLQGVVKYLPLNYLSDALRQVMTEGAHLVDIKTDIYGLIVWSVITITLAIIFFRWQEE